jgi:mono/diheme cytochrome c family protein
MNWVMKNYYILVLLVLIGFLPVLSACGQSQKDSTSKAVQASKSPFASIKQQMDKINESFQKDSSRFSEATRQTYHQMHSLWITMQARHAQMIQNRGRMMGSNGGMTGGGMMRHGMMGNSGRMQARMLSYVRRMQQMMNKSGNKTMASMFAKMRSMISGMQPGVSGSVPDSTTAYLSGDKAIHAIDGKRLFENTCSSCHGSNGSGMAGVFPPLNGSPIVAGNKEVPIKIVLQGLEGPIKVNKVRYNSMMPSFGGSYSDAQIAAIITYLRSLSKNKAGEVTAKDVEEVRKQVTNHSGYWTAKELGIK